MPSPDNPRTEFERLRNLIAIGESQLGLTGDYLIVPQEGVAYASGTLLPVIGGPSATRRPAEGLRLPGADPASDDYMGTYVTLEEYFPAAAGIDLQIEADAHRRESLLTALVAVNRMVDHPTQLATATNDLIQVLPDDVGERLRVAMRIPTGGMGRRIVAPHPLLMAMRWLIGRPPRSQPIADQTTPLDAVVFSHAIAAELQSLDGEEPRELSADDARRLMLALMNLGVLSEHDDVYASIDRTVRLWNQYGHLTVKRLGRDAATLFTDCAGLAVEDFLAVGFALLSLATTWEPGQPVLVQRTIHADMPADLRDRALLLLSRTLQDCYDTVGDAASQFDLLAIESHPVVALPAGLAILDERLLWRRCTSGLFWIVHDALKAISEADAERFRTAHGSMIEALVEDSFRAMAPTVLGGGKSYYTEEDLEDAYGQVARCDAVIDFGDSMLLVEIVSGRLSVQARVRGDLAKLEQDFDRLVLEKCEQLNAAADLLLADEQPLTGLARTIRYPTLLPALVVGGGFPLNPLSYSYIRSRLADLQYLQQARVTPLCVLDLDDVDELEGLAEHGYSVVDLLRRWQDSDLRDVPLRNFILRQEIPDERRPTRMKTVVDATFQDVVGRLRIRRTADPQDEPDADQS